MSERFVIVGGGTAGWLAALMLRDAFKRQKRDAVVIVVESSKIPAIGVGEGTTAVFRQMLKYFDLDEFAFLKDTEATIKFGIRHRDWRRLRHSYDGPIDDPHLVLEQQGAAPQSYLDIFSVAAGRPVKDTHLFGYLLDQHKAPWAWKPDGTPVAMSPFHHAFHFDQALAGKWLRKHAKGVETIDAQVSGARRDVETGDIEALITGAGEVEGDFFIDCTGFRKSLITGVLGGAWVSYRNILPVNRAMPFWVDLKDGEEIPPFTLAWAQGSGWLWSIPTQTRYGMGYVYSDEFLTPGKAKEEIEVALGHAIEPRNDLRFDIGRQKDAWINNCLALGLSSSFLEPLEATSIHGSVVQLMVFTNYHLNRTPEDRNAYNAFAARQVDDFRDFINMHYVSERRDTPFWKHVAEKNIGAPAKERLERWQGKMPEYSDFEPLPGRFAHTEQQLYYPVLDGLGLLNRGVAQRHMERSPELRKKAKTAADSLTAEYRSSAPKAIGHRAFLQSL
ncbi:MAG: tryptophan 7-halogenase [Rhizobiales bacterium]|nr:tryptophan 7-halogenase [Hyphomicrobiales bacterium]